MLRLEHLFSQLAHHRQDSSAWGLRASIAVLIDILSVFSRNDLKAEITRELQDKYQTLLPLRDRPGVDSNILDATLSELQSAINAIQDCSSQKISQTLKESEFLLAVINRSAIPGGTSHMDLPQFHRWLQGSSGTNAQDLASWVDQLQVFEQAAALYLRMLRQSSDWKDVQTVDGLHTQKSQDGFHLIRISIPANECLYPEISAGRQRFSVRFMQQDSALQRETHIAKPITFKLSLCSL